MDEVNQSGVALLSHNIMDGRFIIRYAIGNIHTTEEDVKLVWEKVSEAAASQSASSGF